MAKKVTALILSLTEFVTYGFIVRDINDCLCTHVAISAFKLWKTYKIYSNCICLAFGPVII